MARPGALDGLDEPHAAELESLRRAELSGALTALAGLKAAGVHSFVVLMTMAAPPPIAAPPRGRESFPIQK